MQWLRLASRGGGGMPAAVLARSGGAFPVGVSLFSMCPGQGWIVVLAHRGCALPAGVAMQWLRLVSMGGARLVVVCATCHASHLASYHMRLAASLNRIGLASL